MELTDDDLQQLAEADQREVQVATWSSAGQLDWWVKERLEWFGRVRGKDRRQRRIKAADLRPAKSE